MLRQLSPHLYLYNSTCSVYALVRGDEVVLIDFGDGSVLDELATRGLRATDVLMTHHHRDQGQGLVLAAAAGARIWVPRNEQHFFAEVEAHWQAREIFNSYNSRQDRFSLLDSVPVTGTLRDYETRTFGTFPITVVPTPGHTTGSISLLTEVDGQRVAFTGDLIAAPGKVWSLAATQWTYNGAEGVPATIASLLDLKDRKPDMLLPSHGNVMSQPDTAIVLLVDRLWALLRARNQNPRLFQLREKPYEPITPHLLKHRASMANTYVLLSETGHALMIDFGYDFITGLASGTDRAARRPWLYTLPALKRDFGVQKIEVALPTHYHDDHIAGFNLLREVEGTEVWAAETFADILETPARFDLPCLWYDPIPVDRRLPLNEHFQWREYTFTLHPLPGHTRFAVAIEFVVDGKRVLATGDQYQGNDGLEWNYVYPNLFEADDYVKSAELYRRVNPELILTGHWEPMWVNPEYFDRLDERGAHLEQLHRDLLPLATVDFGAEGFGARIQPYQVTARGGEPVVFSVEVTNPFPQAAEGQLLLVLPQGWAADPPEVCVALEARAHQQVSFRLTPPTGLRVRRARIAVDLTVAGQRFGQQAEALVTVVSEFSTHSDDASDIFTDPDIE